MSSPIIFSSNFRMHGPRRDSSGEHSELSFSFGGSRGSDKYHLEKPTKSDLQQFPTWLFGGTELAPPSAGLPGFGLANVRRILPQPHPWARGLVFTGITSLVPVGNPTTTQPATGSAIFGQIRPWQLYENYEMAAEYGAPPYTIRLDEAIPTVTAAYYNRLGQLVPYNYAPEWWRYTEITPERGVGQVLTWERGSRMYAETSDNQKPGAADPVDAANFAQQQYQVLPDTEFQLKWYAVPYRYWTSPFSYLRLIPRGVINQTAWFDPKADGNHMFTAGSLRLMDISFEIYQPPIPASVGSWFGIDLGNDDSKLINVIFNFQRTNRDRLASRVSASPPSNLNWLKRGWNLQPMLEFPNEYFYFHTIDADASTNQALWKPVHNSFPFQLLTTDPDAPQPARGLMIEVKPDPYS